MSVNVKKEVLVDFVISCLFLFEKASLKKKAGRVFYGLFFFSRKVLNRRTFQEESAYSLNTPKISIERVSRVITCLRVPPLFVGNDRVASK